MWPSQAVSGLSSVPTSRRCLCTLLPEAWLLLVSSVDDIICFQVPGELQQTPLTRCSAAPHSGCLRWWKCEEAESSSLSTMPDTAEGNSP